MSGVLKVVGILAFGVATVLSGGLFGVAAGATFLGLSAGALTLIGLGASIAGSLLAPRPKPPANSPENYNRLRATIEPRTYRKTAIGETALATDIRDEEFTGNQAYLHRFMVVASHKVHSIDEIWFDDKQAWTSGGGVTSDFTGYLTVTAITEGSAANAINISSRMGSTRRYTGCAYVYLKYKLTGNSDSEQSPFAQGVTTRITVRGHAALFYDPRLDSTVSGGSGSMRADDQSTWAWDDDACRNPALALLFYLLGWRITNPVTSEDLLAVGKGIPPERIDLESFAIAANLCDEDVDKVGGGTEPRYRCDGLWSEGDDPTRVLDMLKATMNADLDDIDGKLRLTIFHDDLSTPAADFTDDDVLDDFDWTPCLPLDQMPNVVIGHFTDPSDASLYQAADFPAVNFTSPDGIDRNYPLDLPMVQSVSQAQRLASLRLLRMYYGGTFRATFQATAWAVQKNDVVRLTFAQRGFTNKLFRVAEMDLREDGMVPLLLREENALIYESPSLLAALDLAATTPRDPSLDAIIARLNQAPPTVGQLLRDTTFNSDYWSSPGVWVRDLYAPAQSDWAVEFYYTNSSPYGAYAGDLNALVPIQAGTAVFFAITMDSTVSTPDADWTMIIDAEWFDSSKTLLSRTAGILTFAPDAGGAKRKTIGVNPPTGAAFCGMRIGHNAEGASKVGTWRIYDPWIAQYDPGADVSSSINGLASVNIACTYAGVPKAGEVNPRYVQFLLMKNGVDVTNDATWSRTVLTGTATCAMGNTASTDKGRLNITGPADNTISESTVTITAVYEAATRVATLKILPVKDDAPVGGGGGGGTSASGAVSATVTTTSLVAISDELDVTVGSAGHVDLSASYTVSPYDTTARYVDCRWYEWNGSAFVAIGSGQVQSSSAAYFTSYPGGLYPVPGYGSCNYTRTGLTPSSTQKYKLYGRAETGGQHSISGTCSAVGS